MTTKPSPGIPDEEWKAPVSFDTEGQLVSLREYVHPTRPILSIAQLTPEQRAAVTAQRIAHRPKFEVAIVGVGMVNKERALVEVRGQSQVGRVLIEIEFRVISILIEQARES